MHVLRFTTPIAVVLAGLFTGGCKEESRPATSPTEVTGATTTTGANAARSEITQLQRERNEAQARLAEERSARERERQRETQEAALRDEHDNLEMRVVQALEKADQEMQTLREKGARAATKQRQTIDKTLTEAQQHKSKLYADLKRLHGDLGQSWEGFRADVESTLTSLDRTLSTAPEKK